MKSVTEVTSGFCSDQCRCKVRHASQSRKLSVLFVPLC